MEKERPDSIESEGGRGEYVHPHDRPGVADQLLEDPKRLRSDLAMLRRSIRWGAGQARREKLVDQVYTAATGALAEGDYRSFAACAKTAVSMEAQDQADEHLPIKLEAAANKPAQVIQVLVVNDGPIPCRPALPSQ